MKRRAGFTLVEIMIVVAIIGLLATIAIPSFMKARRTARVNRFANDMRVAADAFILYNVDNNAYPPDGMPGAIPPGMDSYLSGMDWTASTTIGGSWDWDFEQFGYVAGVSVFQPSLDVAEMTAVDNVIDDGNLATGSFRSRAAGYISIIEF